jgi:hypothetical protein
MGKMQIAQAPRLQSRKSPHKWKQEKQAFLRLRDSLRRKYYNKYVAIHQGKVVGSGTEKVSVGLRAYSRFGYIPIYVGYVGEQLHEIVRAPSPRITIHKAGN